MLKSKRGWHPPEHEQNTYSVARGIFSDIRLPRGDYPQWLAFSHQTRRISGMWWRDVVSAKVQPYHHPQSTMPKARPAFCGIWNWFFFAGRTHKANAWGLYEKALFTSCLFTILTVIMFIVMSCGHTVSKHVDNILLLANGTRNSITVVVGWGHVIRKISLLSWDQDNI